MTERLCSCFSFHLTGPAPPKAGGAQDRQKVDAAYKLISKTQMRKKYIRSMVFITPLTGHFRYKNEFQIYPCDFANAPNSKHASDFPMVIEFWIDEIENPDVPQI